MRVLQVNYQMDMMVLSSPEQHSTEMCSSCNSAGNSCGRWALVLHMASFGRGSPSSDSQGISSKETLKKKEKQKQQKKTTIVALLFNKFLWFKNDITPRVVFQHECNQAVELGEKSHCF